MLGLANWWIEEKIKIYQCVGNGKESDIKENTVNFVTYCLGGVQNISNSLIPPFFFYLCPLYILGKKTKKENNFCLNKHSTTPSH
jgi:hypothetical protein